MQNQRTRAIDSRGRPVTGLYVRDGRFVAGFRCPASHKWRTVTLAATTLTDARLERTSLIAGLREKRIAAKDNATFEAVFAEHQASRKLSPRTVKHERHLLDRHLADFKTRPVQELTAADVRRLLRAMSDRYSDWTCVAVFQILKGTFALAVRDDLLTASPIDKLAPSERPKQKNARPVQVLPVAALAAFVAAGSTPRWRAALGLYAFAGLRLGEVRALAWSSVDFSTDTITVLRSAQPDGTFKETKTPAGVRPVPMLPALRRALVEWKLKAPHSLPGDLVIGTADGKPVAERNLRRVISDTKKAAGLEHTVGRLSAHSLRHAWFSALATDAETPPTTLARAGGHTDGSFSVERYARDARDEAVYVKDVLTRANRAGFGS